ncbi:MAG TPA: twin-arginine translocase TatA/TatE family subunit [Thermaerobacter sp.]
MGQIGLPEILLIAVVALVIFGPARLPELGRAVGRAMREFRSAVRGVDEDEPAGAAGQPGEGRGTREGTGGQTLDPRGGAGAGTDAAPSGGGHGSAAPRPEAQGGSPGPSGAVPATEGRGERRQEPAG